LIRVELQEEIGNGIVVENVIIYFDEIFIIKNNNIFQHCENNKKKEEIFNVIEDYDRRKRMNIFDSIKIDMWRIQVQKSKRNEYIVFSPLLDMLQKEKFEFAFSVIERMSKDQIFKSSFYCIKKKEYRQLNVYFFAILQFIETGKLEFLKVLELLKKRGIDFGAHIFMEIENNIRIFKNKNVESIEKYILTMNDHIEKKNLLRFPKFVLGIIDNNSTILKNGVIIKKMKVVSNNWKYLNLLIMHFLISNKEIDDERVKKILEMI
jgi:hypothetical protein